MRRLVPALLGAACLLLAGCSSGTPPGEPPTADPVRARAVATQEFGLLSGGGWAQAWNLWSPDAQQVISRADFVRVNSECGTWLGVPYRIDEVTPKDRTTALVTWHRAGRSGHSEVIDRNGDWRFVPDQDTLARYRRGVTGALAALRGEHACR